MSDEIIKIPEGVGPSTVPTGIYDHYCEHPGCKKWGGWGYGSTKTEPPRWYCYEHRAEGVRRE